MNFQKLVSRLVYPTLKTFGFINVSNIQDIIRFENNKIGIVISYDNKNSFEVDMNIYKKNKDISYDLYELKEYFTGIPNNMIAAQVASEENVIKWLEELDNFLRLYLKEIINNEGGIFEGLYKLREKNCDEYENKKYLELLEREIEELWRAKKYSELVLLLKKDLSKFKGSMKKKYEIAKAKLNKQL